MIISRAFAVVSLIVTIIAMNLIQIAGKSGLNYKLGEVLNPETPFVNGTAVSLIGYILLILAALASVAMIFVNKFLGEKKMVKLVDYIIAGVFVVGAILVALTVVWYVAANDFPDMFVNQLSLPAGPIVAVVFAGIAACLNVVNGLFLEDRI